MKKLIALLLALVMVLGLAACSETAKTETPASTETAEPSTSSTNEPAASESESTGEEFKVGIILPLTGNYAEFGQGQKVAYTMAIEEINAAGGVNGKPVAATFEDSGSDPTVSAELLKKFIEDPSYNMVFGDYDSGTSLAMAPIAQEAGFPMMCCSASSANIPLTGDYVFSMVGVQQDEQRIVVMEVMGNYLNSKKAALVYLDNSWGQTIYENQLTAFEADPDIELVAEIPVASGETDFASVVTKLRESGADCVMLALQITETAACVNYMAQDGYSSEVNVVLAGAAYSDQLLELAGANMEGMVITQPFFIDPENTTMVEWCNEYTERSQLAPNMMTACAYDGLKMCCEAIDAAGATTRAEIRDAMAGIENFQGITGVISFDNVGTVHRLQNLIGVEDGQWVLLENTSFCEGYEPYVFEGYNN